MASCGFWIRRRLAEVSCIVGLVIANPGWGAEQGHGLQQAHEHGRGRLNIVVAGEDLAIELMVPAANVVGFEHAATGDEERAAVAQALARYQRAQALFIPTAQAKCVPKGAQVSLGGASEAHHEDDHADHEDDHAHEDDHEDDHAREEEGEPEKKHESAAQGERTHSEFRAEYLFHCQKPERLTGVEVMLFEHLIDTKSIVVQLVTETRQTRLEIAPRKRVVELSR